MAYTLYTDKNENFECEVSVKNASMKDSFARLVVESENLNLVFKGKIEDGKCIIPIKKLKGLLEENCRGNMHLEMVVEDTFFKPWESDFVVEEHTSVKVKVNEQKEISNKPIVEVKSIINGKNTKKQFNLCVPLTEISTICKQFGINKSNIKNTKKDFRFILNEYFKQNKEYINYKNDILSKLSEFLK